MIFVSYSSKDFTSVNNFISYLDQLGHLYWIDRERIALGERFIMNIANALNKTSIFILFESHNSENSYWVNREVNTVIRLRKENKMIRFIVLNLKNNSQSIYKTIADQVIKYRKFDTINFRNELVKSKKSKLKNLNIISIAEKPGVMPDPAYWLGYSAELELLDTWLYKDSNCIWIKGIGGSGKTSLVKTWITGIEKLGYRRKLELKILIFYCYDNSNYETLEIEVNEWLVANKLANKLLFIDGTEVISDNMKFKRMIKNLLRINNRLKLIVTSRKNEMVKEPNLTSLHLKSLNENDAISLLEGKELSFLEKQELIKSLSSNPLGISLLKKLLENGRFNFKDFMKN